MCSARIPPRLRGVVIGLHLSLALMDPTSSSSSNGLRSSSAPWSTALGGGTESASMCGGGQQQAVPWPLLPFKFYVVNCGAPRSI